jgi:hypothetical protein
MPRDRGFGWEGWEMLGREWKISNIKIYDKLWHLEKGVDAEDVSLFEI